jgi:hypothetical protein
MNFHPVLGLTDPLTGRYARQLVVAKIPSLRALDAAAVRMFSVGMPLVN